MVIIGGTSGMGLATAKMLIDGGARVLVTGLSKAGLGSAQEEIGKHAITERYYARWSKKQQTTIPREIRVNAVTPGPNRHASRS